MASHSSTRCLSHWRLSFIDVPIDFSEKPLKLWIIILTRFPFPLALVPWFNSYPYTHLKTKTYTLKQLNCAFSLAHDIELTLLLPLFWHYTSMDIAESSPFTVILTLLPIFVIFVELVSAYPFYSPPFCFVGCLHK
ncbi:hypothetical protein E1B28_000773 [Marasmius oreades]|uniref:Uncharacterized protein n=1 Tax=Marasmius oreades TaxID=181124 RepID=A0A9P7V210_9AGAR|nr:uncharacterized protein E1B28_000773 [Marasmius oreades]KAG7098873.1 hypothetical protein E1B28_000773 [Marasmius oreades]